MSEVHKAVAFFDTSGIDTVVNCELKNPDFGEPEAAAAPSAAAKMSSDKADALRAR